jgi:hypothetical protein
MTIPIFFDAIATDVRALEVINLVDDVTRFLISEQMYMPPAVAAALEGQYVRGFTDPVPAESYMVSWRSILEMFDLPISSSQMGSLSALGRIG